MNKNQTDVSKSSLTHTRNIPLSEIRENPELQPRSRVDEDHVVALASGFEKTGQLNAILVRPLEENISGFKYEIIGGSHRFRAAGLLDWETIRCHVKNVSFAEAQIIALLDNEPSLSMSDYERAHVYQRLFDSNFASSQQELANLLGISRARISQCLVFFKLPIQVQEILDKNPGLFSYRVAASLREFISNHSDDKGQVDPDVLAVVIAGLEQLKNGAPVSGLLSWIRKQLTHKKPIETSTELVHVLSEEGVTMFKVKNRKRSMIIECLDLERHSLEDIQKGVLKMLQKLA